MANKNLLEYDYYRNVLRKQLQDIASCAADAKAVTDLMREAGLRLASPTQTFGALGSVQVALKPGLYAVFGSAGSGKSTIMRNNFDRALSHLGERFVAVKGGEPEYPYLTPVAVADAVSTFATTRGEPGSGPLVMTVDSIARLMDYDLLIPKSDRDGRLENAFRGDPTLGGDPVARALSNASGNFKPASNTKTTGIAGGFFHLIFTWDAMLARALRYGFMIINAGLSDSQEFRNTVKGLCSGSIELESADETLVRCIPLITSKDVDSWFDARVAPASRITMINDIRVNMGASGKFTTVMEQSLPGAVPMPMIGGGDV